VIAIGRLPDRSRPADARHHRRRRRAPVRDPGRPCRPPRRARARRPGPRPPPPTAPRSIRLPARGLLAPAARSAAMTGIWLPSTDPPSARDPRPRRRSVTRGVVIHVNVGTFAGHDRTWFSGARGAWARMSRSAQTASTSSCPSITSPGTPVDANAFSVGFEHAGYGAAGPNGSTPATSSPTARTGRRGCCISGSWGPPLRPQRVWPHSWGRLSRGQPRLPRASLPVGHVAQARLGRLLRALGR